MRNKPIDVAIIGLGMRLPGARTADQFWKNLSEGREECSQVLASDLRAERLSEALLLAPGYVPTAHILDDYDCFDASFFGIHPDEAASMDPQHRLLLECAWHALEDAGYAPDNLDASVGVYAGSGGVVSSQLLSRADVHHDAIGRTGGPWHVGNDKDFVPTRISYKLNLRGPSIAVQTACSTALVAIHLGCQSLAQGECSMVLAGAASVRVPHRAGYFFERDNIYSADGHVRAFDAAASGTVFGSGLGLVVLKPLAAAQADGDCIRGVIKGSAINNDGGRKMSFLATRMDGQIECIRKAFEQSGVAASTIGYVEAHGTGTLVGDPIEINALTRAFREQTAEVGFCAVGSVKNNIGHLDIASGMASVLKVCLALERGSIPPCINFDVANPKIRFNDSPFFVNTKAIAWPHADSPRRAAINGLGIGGTNAFLIIEQAPPCQVLNASSKTPVLMVISARSEAALWRNVERLHAWLPSSTAELHDIAATLAVGRRAFAFRCAIVVSDREELVAKLDMLMRDRHAADAFISVNPRRETNRSAGLVEFAAHLCEQLASGDGDKRARQLTALADLWARGVLDELSPLFGRAWRRVSMPGYAFEPTRFPVHPDVSSAASKPAAATSWLHPLVHANVSDRAGLAFAAVFTGEEFFLRDHQVGGSRVLPGAAQLEMARAAYAALLTNENIDALHVHLSQVVWARAITSDKDGCRLSLRFLPAHGQRLGFVIEEGGNGPERTAFSQGFVEMASSSAPPRMDLVALRSRFALSGAAASEVYATLGRHGFDYGDAFRGLRQVAMSQGEVFAEVVIPDTIVAGHNAFIIHPSLLDAAWQAGRILDGDTRVTTEPALPFAMASLDSLGPAPLRAWAWLRPSHQSAGALDIDLCDDDGDVFLRIAGFSTRNGSAMGKPLPHAAVKEQRDGVLLLRPYGMPTDHGATPLQSDERLILLCAGNPTVANAVASRTGARVVALPAEGMAEGFVRLADALLAELQSLLRARVRAHVQVVIPAAMHGWEGLGGLLDTAKLENPAVQGQLLCVSDMNDVETLLVAIGLHGGRVRHTTDGWRVRRWEPIVPLTQAPPPWKVGGTYLITGGLGGLGLLFAEEIGRHGARAVLVGRSVLDAAKTSHLAARQARGLMLEYHAVDLADAAAVHALVAELEQRHGGLHGIVHSAGVIRDNYLIRKTADELRAVLAPKVQGLVHLDEATAHLDLDVVVLFSSLAGALGNAGQGDYAAANGFMDGYASWRNEAVKAGTRHGRTVSINWPLWADGGMRVDDATRTLMREQAGMLPLETAAGIAAFYAALHAGVPQVLVVSGDLAHLRRKIVDEADAATVQAAAAVQPVAEALAAWVLGELRMEVASLLRVDESDLDADAELSEYGFDSMSLTRFANRLNQRLGLSLMPTIFFEYPSLGSLATHLAAEHAAALGAQTALDTAAPAQATTVVAAATDGWRYASTMSAAPSVATDPVAIIGMSGCFPQAPDLDTFWNNLREGRDSVQEIPASRWDWRAHAGDPGTEVKWGAFIEGVDQFDPLFFNISPREAALMDPQQRLLLMYAWAAIEDAGHAPSSLAGSRTGVFVGTAGTGYDALIAAAGVPVESYLSTSIVPSVGPNRLSYLLDLHGPSEPIETACSSSLVAIHRAILAMDGGGCDMALVGGVQTYLTPTLHLSFSKAGMLCADGRCKTFSAQANGYVRGEGVGMLVLRRLSAAQAQSEGTGRAAGGGLPAVGDRAGDGGVYRSARHGHGAGRPGGSERAESGVRDVSGGSVVARGAVRTGDGQKQHRASGTGGGDRRGDQGAAAIAARHAGAEPAQSAMQSVHCIE
jgi:polyketide synthase PksN